MAMNIYWTYCSDHFVISTNTESLPYTPETNVISIIPQ